MMHFSEYSARLQQARIAQRKLRESIEVELRLRTHIKACRRELWRLRWARWTGR